MLVGFSLFLFFLSLFLGDGKQPIIDIFVGIGLVCVSLWRWRTQSAINNQQSSPHNLSRPVLLSWLVLLIYFALRTIFSDDVGYSMSATTRLFEGFLFFYIFSSSATEVNINRFVSFVRISSIGTILLSFFILLFPKFAQLLPQMNLLYATYGHNPLAGLLVFAAPFFLYQGKEKQKFHLALVGIFLLGVFFTFARGAWLLVGAYLFLRSFYSPYLKRTAIGFSLVVVGVLLSTLIFSSLENHTWPTAAAPWIVRQVIKPLPWQDTRLEYWCQAVASIQARPLFGSGPGTFSLQSRLWQTRPDTNSWFAHNSVLETVSEVGFVGIIIYGVLFFVLFRRVSSSRDRSYGDAISKNILKIVSSKTTRNDVLFHSIILVSLYSLIEFSLNYLVLSCLLWASIGLLYRSNEIRGDRQSALLSPLLMFSCLAILLYSATYFSRNFFSFLPSQISGIGFYNADHAKSYLSSSPLPSLTPQDESWITYSHRKNPDILVALGNTQSDPEQKIRSLARALSYDPMNIYIMTSVLHILHQHPELVPLVEEDMIFVYKTVADRLGRMTIPISDIKPVFVEAFTMMVIDNDIAIQSREGYAKLYYLLAYYIQDKELSIIEHLLITAKNIAPEWSYFHIELAAYYKKYKKDEGLAEKILIQCQDYVIAREHCRNEKNIVTRFFGSMKEQVINMQ